MGKHSSDRTPEEVQALADDFDRVDAELVANHVPQTADERIAALQKINADIAADNRRMTGWPKS